MSKKICEFTLEWDNDDYFELTRRQKEGSEGWGEKFILLHADENDCLPAVWPQVEQICRHAFDAKLGEIGKEMAKPKK